MVLPLKRKEVSFSSDGVYVCVSFRLDDHEGLSMAVPTVGNVLSPHSGG